MLCNIILSTPSCLLPGDWPHLSNLFRNVPYGVISTPVSPVVLSRSGTHPETPSNTCFWNPTRSTPSKEKRMLKEKLTVSWKTSIKSISCLTEIISLLSSSSTSKNPHPPPHLREYSVVYLHPERDTYQSNPHDGPF